MLVSEDVLESVAAAFRPLGVVVAGHYFVWNAQGIHKCLCGSDFLVGAEVGDIASEDGEIQGILAVDVRDAAAQVREGVGARGEVGVGEEREAYRGDGAKQQGGAEKQFSNHITNIIFIFAK